MEDNMKPRCFLDDVLGVSLLHDAVLFIVMVSLAGVALLPALRCNIAVETSVDSHREHTVDEALQTYLVSRADVFEYRFCGDLIDTIAGQIGIQNTTNGLYRSVSEWILGHEQRHMTYATLLAEDLGCQFHLPFSVLGANRLNIFTTELDQHLTNETKRFFFERFYGKYEYNLSAWWHPIKGIPFGGEFHVGLSPPRTDTYVARRSCVMPYSPLIKIGNHTVILTKYWLMHQLFSNDTGLGESSIPTLSNISRVCKSYIAKQPPYEIRGNATIAVRENLSILAEGFLVSGITNTTNSTVFPGVVNATLGYGFDTIKNISGRFLQDALNATFGDAIRMIDRFFTGLNGTVNDPVSTLILQNLNTTLHTFCNNSNASLDETFDIVERTIEENATALLHHFLTPYIESFVQGLFDVIDTVDDFAEMLVNWLFDRVSLTTAEVTLTLWAVRE
jgi:hypothetical protein